MENRTDGKAVRGGEASLNSDYMRNENWCRIHNFYVVQGSLWVQIVLEMAIPFHGKPCGKKEAREGESIVCD